MAASQEDCPCCYPDHVRGDLDDLDTIAVSAFIAGIQCAGQPNEIIAALLCTKHLAISAEALDFLTQQMKRDVS